MAAVGPAAAVAGASGRSAASSASAALHQQYFSARVVAAQQQQACSLPPLPAAASLREHGLGSMRAGNRTPSITARSSRLVLCQAQNPSGPSPRNQDDSKTNDSNPVLSLQERAALFVRTGRGLNAGGSNPAADATQPQVLPDRDSSGNGRTTSSADYASTAAAPSWDDSDWPPVSSSLAMPPCIGDQDEELTGSSPQPWDEERDTSTDSLQQRLKQMREQELHAREQGFVFDAPVEETDNTAAMKGQQLRRLLERRRRGEKVGEEEQQTAVVVASSTAQVMQHGDQSLWGDNGTMQQEIARVNDILAAREAELGALRTALQQAQGSLNKFRANAVAELSAARRQLQEQDARLSAAEAALSQLRKVRVEWWGVANQVLLSGAFDGWTHYIELEPDHSASGARGERLFVAELRLYPGCYETKFIVDGNWVADPRREVVSNNGHENNLLRVV
eukprot:jgi/Chlat1/1630/Chrsp127S01889